MRAGALDPQGPVAESVADLWWLMLGMGTVVFVGFVVVLAVGLVRRPAQEGDVEEQPHIGRWLAGAGVAMPLVVLVVVFAATVAAMRPMPASAPADALVVDVVGHQWWYEVTYPDHGVATVNELHLPVGRPVALRLSSADVIHSFWVPELAGKLDMLPEHTNVLVVQADRPGEYRARCAEFCGLQHAHMEMVVVAESADEFATWISGQR